MIRLVFEHQLAMRVKKKKEKDVEDEDFYINVRWAMQLFLPPGTFGW